MGSRGGASRRQRAAGRGPADGGQRPHRNRGEARPDAHRTEAAGPLRRAQGVGPHWRRHHLEGRVPRAAAQARPAAGGRRGGERALRQARHGARGHARALCDQAGLSADQARDADALRQRGRARRGHGARRRPALAGGDGQGGVWARDSRGLVRRGDLRAAPRLRALGRAAMWAHAAVHQGAQAGRAGALVAQAQVAHARAGEGPQGVPPRSGQGRSPHAHHTAPPCKPTPRRPLGQPGGGRAAVSRVVPHPRRATTRRASSRLLHSTPARRARRGRRSGRSRCSCLA